MAIKGSLKEASLADVCQLLSLGFKTGCLSVADNARFGQIFFEKGRITYARIVNRRDRLGDLLVRDGVLAQSQLEEVLKEQSREPDRRVGELLVEHGYISRSDLTRYVRLQIEEAIYHLFTWSRGNFYFEVDERPQADILVSINPESLMLEAARRVDEWSLIEKKIPSLDLLFEVERDRIKSAGVALTQEQEQLIGYFDGTRSVQEVVDETGLTEFNVGKALFGLIQAGFAHRVGQRADEPVRGREAEVAERHNLGVAFFRTGMLADATREFDRVLQLEASHAGARFHLALIALRDKRLRDGIRQLRVLIDETGPNHAAFINMAVALRALGRADDAMLVLDEAENTAPGHPMTALARGVTLLHAHNFLHARLALDEYRRRLPDGTLPSVEYYYHASLAHALSGTLPAADETIREGLEHYPDAAPLLLMSALLQEFRGDLDGADRSYRRAIEEEGSMAHAHKGLGDVSYRRGSHDEALQEFQRAVEIDPDLSDDVYAKIGNLQYKKRNIEAAVESWKRALALNPENDIVRSNLEIVADAGK
jgi:tetratricopeptide (TPR) repeat protein